MSRVTTKPKTMRPWGFWIRTYAPGLLVILIAAALSSCSSPFSGDSEKTIEIQGHVTDAASGAPIKGVDVVFDRITGLTTGEELARAYTDADGYYYVRYTFYIVDNCKLLELSVNYENSYVDGYGTKLIHVECASGIQVFDVQLSKW